MAIGFVFVAGCGKNAPPIISTSDATGALVEAARAMAASSELPRGYCVEGQLDPAKTVVDNVKDAKGWSTGSTGGLRYRILYSSELGRIPAEAIAALPSGTIGSDCRHRIALHEPEFIEFVREGKTSIAAIVALHDRCPLCGAGYAITLTRQGRRWVVEQSGVVRSWIS